MSDEVPQEQETQAPEENPVEPADFSPGHERGKKKKIPWKPAAGFAAAAILFFAVGFLVRGPSQTTGMAIQGVADKNTVANDILGIITESIKLQGGTGNASLVSVTEESGLYKITLSIDGTDTPFYATEDGKLFMNSYGQISDIKAQLSASASQQQPATVPKTDKPKIELFVMSFCPYGNQAENTMQSVYNLLKDSTDFNVHYIVNVNGNVTNSLHGQPEVDEDQREACILKEYGLDKWWTFTVYVNNNCGGSGSCWENASKAAGIDADKINDCVSKSGLDLMKAEAAATDSAGASGSPTLIINGVKSSAVYQYGNSEAYKEAICSAFNTPPAGCSQNLGASSVSASSSGSCGST
jgi:glutaredoxin